MGGLIGTLAPLGWLGTGYLLADEFNPIALESLAFTSAFTDGLFWTIASTAIAPGFGVGFLAGVVGGSLLASLAAREFAVESFSERTPVGRYMAGGALMGFGGVLAGGCTIGAGLAGAATLSFAAILALGAIGTGVIATAALMRRQAAALQLGYAGQ
jgi:uncharacterized membrane protein YedE/YeeE